MARVPKKRRPSSGKVLVLDSDREGVRRLLAHFGRLGYDIENMTEPSRMIERVKNNQADALIIAVEAQGIKGYDLLPIIKRINRSIPIIVTSMDDSLDVASRVREHGVFFYAIKPIDLKEIELVVKNALSKKLARADALVDEERRGTDQDYEEEILDIDGASKILRLSKATLSRLAHKGEIPGSRIGNRWRFIKNQLFEWLRLTAAGNQRNYGTLILETMDEGVAVVDKRLKIVSCNSAYLQSLDIPRDRIIGEHCYRVSHRSEVPCDAATCPARQAFRTERPVKFMHINYDEDGGAHYCDVVALPIKDDQGRVSEVVEVIRDNTEIYHLNQHLNWVVSFVAHELKGTLGSVVMNISAIVDEKLSRTLDEKKRNEMLLSSLGSLKLMNDMIRNYLISSKGRGGQLQTKMQQVDIQNEVLKPMIEELNPLLMKKSMRIDMKSSGERPVECDRSLMRIAISNLLNNAAKYGAAGTTIECGLNLSDRGMEFTCFNEGSGIPADKLDAVFGEFTRFDTSGVGGTGLGLHVVKMIADLHHGTVRAQSGYIIDGRPVSYDAFYANEDYFELREKEAHFKKYADFILSIPGRVIAHSGAHALEEV